MIPDRWRGRRVADLLLASALMLALAGGTGMPIAAHSPDPALGSELFAQDARLEYDWRTGAVPPAAMRTAIHAAADDINDTRASRAATFAYDTAGTSPIGYGTGTCGVNGLACFTRNAPDELHDVVPRAGPSVRLGHPQVVPDVHEPAQRLL